MRILASVRIVLRSFTLMSMNINGKELENKSKLKKNDNNPLISAAEFF